ncbi:copper chaperone PCu(A)C [Rhodococcus chondri]|uniref:Copper(I)-binding protein n=1 Tax=Rhodococcus chondri TaxID=3065941 RepID=A0ABU7JR90_9NOCA|nr:hypothetical protein [Rhodococcus sp. CC-R104]MEE2032551.1 hypothetical protein [Rhodococcus sp. CC-R104]
MYSVHRSRMPRYRRVRFLIALVAVAGLTVACGAGQISQTSTQTAAINGTNAQLGDLDLRNVYFHAEPSDSGDARYGQVEVAFTVINNSGTTDRLVSVESKAATSLRLEGPEQAREIRPGTALSAGQPVEQLDNPSAPDQPVTVRGEFPDDVIRPGLTYPVTFTFERAGSVTLQVPFDAWTPGEPLPTERPLPPLPADSAE